MSPHSKDHILRSFSNICESVATVHKGYHETAGLSVQSQLQQPPELTLLSTDLSNTET